MDEIFYQIDFDKLEKVAFQKTNIEDIEANVDKQINEFWNTQRFLQIQEKTTINPLAVVKNQGTNELFSDKKSNPEDTLPEPNTNDGGAPCNDPSDCLNLQMKIMKYLS